MQYYYAYPNLGDFLNDAEIGKPVFVQHSYTTKQSGKIPGFAEVLGKIIIQQITSEGNCAYLIYRTSRHETVYGKPFDPSFDSERVNQQNKDFTQIIINQIERAGFQVRRALIAMPNNLDLVEHDVSDLQELIIEWTGERIQESIDKFKDDLNDRDTENG